MKIFATLITLTISIISFGQVATIDVQNPAPRVDDEIEVSFSLDMTHMKGELPIHVDELNKLLDNNIGSGTLKLRQSATDTGKITLGPFKFKINDIEYTSDSITVNVYPKLPTVEKGIWLRQVHFKDKHLLIVEQRILNQSKSNDNNLFIEIDKETLEDENLQLDMKYSGMSRNFRIIIYEVDKSKGYDGQWTIKKENFKNFPDNVSFREIIIK